MIARYHEMLILSRQSFVMMTQLIRPLSIYIAFKINTFFKLLDQVFSPLSITVKLNHHTRIGNFLFSTLLCTTYVIYKYYEYMSFHLKHYDAM